MMTEKEKCGMGMLYDANNDEVLIAERQVCVLPGVTIGDNWVIGAGSVVTKDIPTNSLAYGNLCRVIRTIDEYDK